MDPNGSKQIQLGAKGSVWVQIGPNKMGSKSPNKYQTGQNGIFSSSLHWSEIVKNKNAKNHTKTV